MEDRSPCGFRNRRASRGDETADGSHFLPRRDAETVIARRSLEMMSITADIAEETILRGLVTHATERGHLRL
jgi:hypothetical protein